MACELSLLNPAIELSSHSQICATINLNKEGKQEYVSGFGGNEFYDACQQGASACSDASGKSIGSECD